MRKLTAFFLVLSLAAVGCASFAHPTQAGTVQVTGTHSPAEIAGACKAAGGVPFGSDAGGEDYGCETTKGQIKCNNGKCIGQCDSCGSPAIKHGGTDPVLGVLSGTTLKAGPSTPAKGGPTAPTKGGPATPTKITGTPNPLKQPPIVDRNSGPANNGEAHQGKNK
jgi:hypothetical protein